MERARLRKEQEQQVIAQREKEEAEEKFQQLELRHSDLFAALVRRIALMTSLYSY